MNMMILGRINILLSKLPQHKQVIFAAYCCNSVKHLMNPESLKCLELLEKWIEDNGSVSMEELDLATTATAISAQGANFRNIVSTTAYAAYAVGNTAETVFASTQANATHSAHAAAHAATNAVAPSVTTKIKRRRIKEYEAYLLKMIDELTPLEKEFTKD